MNHIYCRLVSCCCLLLLVDAASDHLAIKEAFEQYMIVPQCIPTPPKEFMSIIFRNKTVSLETWVHPFETINVPYVSYPNNPSALYTFVIFDPDIPFMYLPMGGQQLQALLVNAKGQHLHAADRVGVYVPHIPCPGSGSHRSVWLAYKQSYPIPVTAELRYRFTNLTNFNMYQFSKEYQLGNPVAGNFFVSELTACDFH